MVRPGLEVTLRKHNAGDGRQLSKLGPKPDALGSPVGRGGVRDLTNDGHAKGAPIPQQSTECSVPGAPLPAEELARYSLAGDPHADKEVAFYVESQAPDETVRHVEKVKSEYVLGTEYRLWDVTTDRQRWWVIEGQLMNLYPQLHFQSLDYTLSFHIGLTSRMQSRDTSEQEADLAPFDEVDRRFEQAASALERAIEAEEYQSVGMQLREGLITLVAAVRRRADLGGSTVERPKDADFVGWTDVLVSHLLPSSKNKILRQYLKQTALKTWQLVNALTHDRDAGEVKSSIALQACRVFFGHMAQLVFRRRTSDLQVCPKCASRGLRSHFDRAIGSDGDYYLSCGKCGWSSHPDQQS